MSRVISRTRLIKTFAKSDRQSFIKVANASMSGQGSGFWTSSPAYPAGGVYISEIMNTASSANRASIVVALSFAMALVGCGPTSSAFVSSNPTPTTSASSSPTATGSPVPSSSPSDTPSPQPTAGLLAGFTCADASGGSEQTGSDVVGVRVGQHDGYDRLVIEFSGPIPSYKVQRRSGTSFTASPRGQTVTLRGTNGVLIVVHPIFNWTSYSGPSAFQPDYRVLREARQVENFEGYQQWALGIQGSPCLRVTTLTSPSRLVVDVAAAQ